MSQRPVRSLVCDKPLCTARFVIARKRLVSEGTLRRAARQQGWKRTPGNRDYCPDHNPWPGFTAWATTTPTGGAA
ncbi:hypothetical protein AB0E62_37115 [Streptomyces sp. NPDC038707]|uniref:hypothetical protein n=1 Tax=Streptomyces sp. NPDC038707 TaxID=3154329 RepID=UPI0033F05D82